MRERSQSLQLRLPQKLSETCAVPIANEAFYVVTRRDRVGAWQWTQRSSEAPPALLSPLLSSFLAKRRNLVLDKAFHECRSRGTKHTDTTGVGEQEEPGGVCKRVNH